MWALCVSAVAARGPEEARQQGSLLASRAERPHTARHAELRAVITCTQIHRKFRKRSPRNTAAIAGGVVGGVVALCLVAGVAFLIFKKKTTGGSVRSPKAATTVAPE